MRGVLFALVLVFGSEPRALELEQGATVRIDVPTVVLFQVTQVTQATVVSGFRVSFNQAKLGAGQALRVSVKADGPLIVGGVSVPLANVTWTTSAATNGTGMNGALSTAAYTQVFESRVNASTGRVDLAWSLILPPGITIAGTGQVTLRWKLEAVIP